MSVTINSIGANSRQIVVTNETGPSNIIDGINTALTSLGWTLYDTVTSGSRNMFVTKVYSAPNNDSPTSPTTKYMILRFEVAKQRWWVSCCESWNTTTHVPTNECWYANRNFPLGFQNSNLIIYVFATARYAAFQTAVRGELGIWQGVFEWERGDMVEDTAATGAPCFGWTNARIFATPYDQYESTGAAMNKRFSIICPPRTYNGYTGIGAARQFTLSTAFGDFPPNHMVVPNGSIVSATYGDTTGLGIAQIYYNGATYANNTTSKLIINPKLGPAGSSYINTGRIYGITISPSFGDQLDTVSIPIDDKGFYSNTGTSTTHYVMGLTGGNLANIRVDNLKLSQRNFNTGTGTHQMVSAVIVDGKKIICGTNAANTVSIYDLDGESWTNITTTHGTSSSGIVYDGESKVYIGGTLGILKIDTANNTTWRMDATATSGGYVALAIDDNNLYASWYTASTTPKHEKISLSSFTVSNTLTSVTAASGTWNGLYTEFDGNLYMFSFISGGATFRFAKVSTANNVVLFNNAYSFGTYGPAGMNCWYDGFAWNLRPIASGNNLGSPYMYRLYSDGTAAGSNNAQDGYGYSYAYGGTGLAAGRIAHEPIPFFGGRIGQTSPLNNLSSSYYPVWVQPPINSTALTEYYDNSNIISPYQQTYVIGNTASPFRSRLGVWITDNSTIYNLGTPEAYNTTNATGSGSTRFTGQMSVRNMNASTANNLPHVLIKA